MKLFPQDFPQHIAVRRVGESHVFLARHDAGDRVPVEEASKRINREIAQAQEPLRAALPGHDVLVQKLRGASGASSSPATRTRSAASG